MLLLSSPPPTMKQENNKDNSKTQTLKPEQKTLLLHSIAKYLENTGGFSKTLKKFESEAKFEVQKSKTSHSLFLYPGLSNYATF